MYIKISLICSLNDLEEFIKVAKSGLSVEIGEDDYDGLVGVMGHLMAVKDRQATTDNMFEPLKETIELLQSYDQVMSDAVHQQLEVWHEKLHTPSCNRYAFCLDSGLIFVGCRIIAASPIKCVIVKINVSKPK